jgi:hypothetical protein
VMDTMLFLGRRDRCTKIVIVAIFGRWITPSEDGKQGSVELYRYEDGEI